MNLCRAVGRKEARFRGVVATADRVRCGEAYGSRPPPPCVRETPTLNVQTRSKEAGCLAREGRLCCGGGGSAGDCVGAAGPSRRRRRSVLWNGSMLSSEVLMPPARFVGKKRTRR